MECAFGNSEFKKKSKIIFVIGSFVMFLFSLSISNYPSCRVKKDTDSGLDMGVAGTVELLQNMNLATQPLSSFDWCPDKLGLAICTGFDQTVRMIIVTKLNQF